MNQTTVGAAAISQAIRAVSQTGQPALVAFITAGYPSKEQFVSDLKRIGDAADVVEIGVPFTDPMADGLTIQRSSQKALENGVSLTWILNTLEQAAERPKSPLLLMSYLNPLISYGLDRLPQAMRASGVSGVIVPDLPLEESQELQQALNREGLALVQLVSPVTPADRLENIVKQGQGFIYAVTLTGTTGKQVVNPAQVTEYLSKVRRLSKVPVCAGFGIRAKEHVAALQSVADGVIVGSALIEVLEKGADPVEFLKSLRTH